MTITLFAQPYDVAATGFYFESADDFAERAANLVNDFGEPVEEFEIQFIDGNALDAELADAVGIWQGNITDFFEVAERLGDHDKTIAIIAARECGYEFAQATHPGDLDVDIYEVCSLRELAEQFADEGLFGDIPDHLANYIDYEAIARDLAADYSETTVGGRLYVYRLGQ